MIIAGLNSSGVAPADLVDAINVPATNTAAVITIAADTDRRAIIHNLTWSYDAAPTGGRLTITKGGVIKFDIDIIAGGPGSISREVAGLTNSAVVVTLAAGAAQGKLNVSYSLQLM